MKLPYKCTLAFFTLLVIFLSQNLLAAANDNDVCTQSIPPVQDPPQGGSYSTRVNNPVYISSQEAGYQMTGCGVATVGASTTRANVLDPNGNKETKTSIINQFAAGVKLSASNGGTFDEQIAAAVSILNKDPVNCYRITIKRIKSYTDKPIVTLPVPTKQTIDNVEIVTYRPYNFNALDILMAINDINKNAGGVGLGGVAYDSSNKDKAAHMFQPVALGAAPYKTPTGGQEQDIQIYDSYFNANVDLKLKWDANGKMYINLWSQSYPQWFHLEELYTLENMGPTFCAARNAQGAATTKPGIPVNANGPVTGGKGNGGNNGAVVNPITLTPIPGPITPRPVGCPNGRLEPGEECDDGNTIDIDDCNNSCKITKCGDGIVQLFSSRKETCEPPNGQPNSACRLGSYQGICMSNCKCGPPPVLPA